MMSELQGFSASTLSLATDTANSLSALALLSIACWLVLLVQKTRVPFSNVFLIFAFCLAATAGGHVSGFSSTVTAALAITGALASAATAILLFPRLPGIVKAIRGLYLSETRRRMLEDYADELKAVNHLREKEAKDFEAIASSSSDQIYRLSATGAFVYTSPAVTGFFGLPKAELRGATWATLNLGEENEKILKDTREKVMETGLEARGNLSITGKSGTRNFDFLCSPIVEGGKTIALTFNFRDVTEKKNFELELVKAYGEMERRVEERTEELSASKKSFQDLVNTIDGIVWEAEVGKAGFSFVSSQAERLTGHPLSRWSNEDRFWQKILHPEDLARLTGDRYQHPEQKKDLQSEYRIITADNRVLWMRDHIKVIYHKGRPHKMRGIMVDVTEQKKVETALHSAKEISQRAATVKSEFLANMSHEIRTPLNAIIGMSQIALEGRMDTDTRECLSTVKTAADSLLLLVNDILDFSKIEAGGVKLEISDFRLDGLLRSGKEVIQPLANEKNIRLLLEDKSTLGNGARGDPGRLLQVLMNLLSNAVKFTPVGGEVSVHVSGPEQNAKGAPALRFEVRDNGIGIEESAMKNLFQPFSQADGSTARKYGGTGLGLSICKRLVELMGGRIGVESTPGKGSVFWFEVPAHASLSELKANEESESRAPAALKPNLRVLVADDNPANQKVILRLLEKLGLAPEIVSNGRDAVAAFSSRPFDLVLMDCQMPEMDGYEATREIRRLEQAAKAARKTPVVALTAHALSGDKEKCVEAGMDGYLSKPVSVQQLAKAVSQWTSRAPAAVPPAEQAAAEPPGVIDLDYLKGLEQLNAPGKPDLLVELMGYFLEKAGPKCEAIRRAIEAQDIAMLKRESHAFKSTCFNVGARRLAGICDDLEGLESAGGAELLLKRLNKEAALAQTELNQLMRQRTAA